MIETTPVPNEERSVHFNSARHTIHTRSTPRLGKVRRARTCEEEATGHRLPFRWDTSSRASSSAAEHLILCLPVQIRSGATSFGLIPACKGISGRQSQVLRIVGTD